MQASFPAKVILFGEYSIIAGSQALIIPVDHYSGRLEPSRSQSIDGSDFPESSVSREPQKETDLSNSRKSNRELMKYLEYLEVLSDHFDLERLKSDLVAGMYFNSDIPRGYGLGSSAALVAALFDRYAHPDLQHARDTGAGMLRLREVFSLMESYFHGHSSGIDPLCSYTGHPIFASPSLIRQASLPPVPYSFHLLDSGIKGETGPLVRNFRMKLDTDVDYRSAITERYIPLVNACIDIILKGPVEELENRIRRLSALQLSLFSDMIPEGIRKLWNELLDREIAIPKLCGSGGGGFFLLFTHDPGQQERIASMTGQSITPIFGMPR